MYIVGQEETVVNPPLSVAGVRTVTTNMDGRDVLHVCRAHSPFSSTPFKLQLQIKSSASQNRPGL